MWPLTMCVAGVLLSGCDRQEEITTYTVPKHESLQSQAFLDDNAVRHPKIQRMIGVVLPHEQSLWFFKLEGDVDAVAAKGSDVQQFLATVRFVKQLGFDANGQPEVDKPVWTLPKGWNEIPSIPGNAMRYSTLSLGGDPALEMSVTVLPADSSKPIGIQVMDNLNRWRGQLSLPPINDEKLNDSDLDERIAKLALEAGNAYWINIMGRPRARPQMPPPQRPVQNANPPAERVQPREAKTPEFDKPAGWATIPPAMFAVASFEVAEKDSRVVISITSARGNKLDNVNRWRAQLKLEPISADQLSGAAVKIDVGDAKGELYAISNDVRTILGAMVEQPDQTWFVKLDGNKQLAERERPRFEAFLKSLKFD